MNPTLTLFTVLLLAPLAALHAADSKPAAKSADTATPRLLSPMDRMEMTDVATYFQWAPVEGCTSFDIQIASDAAFNNVFKEKHTVNKGFHRNCYRPKNILAAGTYFWRVRTVMGDKTGPWSTPASVKVNDLHPIQPEVVRKIGPQTPLFLMRSRTWDPIKNSSHVKEIIPAGLERVIIVDDLAMASERVVERAKRYQELGLDFVIWNNRCQVSLATIEYVFQNFSHCIGTAEGEHFDGITWEKGPEGNLAESDFVHHAWMLCAKYGRFYFFADGDAGSYRWPSFVQRDREHLEKYRRNIVPMFKTTKGDMALHSYGAVEGLMVSGLAENCGTWVDEWIWPECGFGKLGEIIPPENIWANRRKVGTKQCPWTYDIQMWLMGIASGSTVFHLESAHQWTPDGSAAQNYPRFFLPFVKAVVERQLIPSRRAFLDSIKIAVTSDLDLAKGKHEKQYAGGFAYLKDLYALKAPGDQEIIPNNSRYGIVCLLPPFVNSLAGRTTVVQQKELLNPATAVTFFNAAYPQRFTGDAFMWECDRTVIVTNTNENQDRTQRFAMPLGNGLVRSLNGGIGVHQYLIGKLAKDGRSFWFQTNSEYPDRDVALSITCTTKPVATVTPKAAAKEMTWDETRKCLNLRLSVAQGAVEVELN